MKLSIVIPAYNEEDRLAKTLWHVAEHRAELKRAGIVIQEVIVVDDGSSDATSEVARKFTALPVHVVRFALNRGKGAAVHAGIERARGEYVLMYDADAATPIVEVIKFKRAIASKGADIVIGSRVLGRSHGLVTMDWHRQLIGRTYHFLCSGLVPGIHDTACGCKLFSRTAARAIFARQRIDRFAFDVEVLSIALGLGCRIAEVPVEWESVPRSKVRVVRDGMQMFWCVIKLYAWRIFEYRKEKKE